MTQSELVYEYMEEHGSITTGEAFWVLGIARLSARIYDLRQQGKQIVSTKIKVSTRRGKKAYVSAYSIGDNKNG